MEDTRRLQAGDSVLVGDTLISVNDEFALSLQEGDSVLGIASSASLRRISRQTRQLVSEAVSASLQSFQQLSDVSSEQIDAFFDTAARFMADDSVFDAIAVANAEDVASARSRGRSTTRLLLSSKMRADMVSAFRMWRDVDMKAEEQIDSVKHEGWTVEQWRSPLGVIGFVFEGRPNVFADATGVLKSGNTVVFRIGSDALRTARAIMHNIVTPALQQSGLPAECVQLLDSAEHAAGWALFSEKRLSLAVARGSGEAVAELGSIAQQSGISVSLHGTGGAWILVGESCDLKDLALHVEHSLDRKVCNTLNTICVPRHRAEDIVPVIFDAARKAGRKRGTEPRIHAAAGSDQYLPAATEIVVQRAEGSVSEPQVSVCDLQSIGHEFEWEENPEFHIVLVDSLQEAVDLFNTYSPQFVVSTCSRSEVEQRYVWQKANAPFVGNGFTRWVDGQFALLRPELGLSNWEGGRLFARGGILSGDSAFTVRLRVTQTDPDLHR